MNPPLAIVLGIIFIGLNFFIYKKAFQASRELDDARIIDKEGNQRKLTQREREQLAWNYAHQKGKHFWMILIGGIILISIVILTLRSLNLIPIK
jgi:hypothetical protein